MFGWFKKKKVLLDIGDYEFPEVVLKRTQNELKITDAQLKLLEVSLKDFFYAVKVWSTLELTNKNVDVLWHNFILDTKSYKKFCDDYIGFFIDHVPFLNDSIVSDKQLQVNLMRMKNASPKHWHTKRDMIISNNQSTNSDNDFLLWAIYLNILSDDNNTNNNYISPIPDIINSSDSSSNATGSESMKSTSSYNSNYSDTSTSSYHSSSDSSSYSHKSSCSSCSSCSSSSGD